MRDFGEPPPFEAARELIGLGRAMHRRGWTPATAGNLSLRLPDGTIAITRSGAHKGHLREADILRVSLAGETLSQGAPSAETGLHLALYRGFPKAGAVLHGHSVPATVLSLAPPGDGISFQGYELQKALGAASHEETLSVPVFDNDRDIPRLAAAIDARLPADVPGYLLRGHGAYVWAETGRAALHRLEALEFLLRCRLEERRSA